MQLHIGFHRLLGDLPRIPLLAWAFAWLFHAFAAHGQPPVMDGTRIDSLIRQFAAPAEHWLPGIITEINPEQMAKLNAVDVSAREESAFGKQVLSRYQEQLKLQGKTIERRGRDVDYLNKLAEYIRPHMIHADRYRDLRIGVIDSASADAYSIPGGELLFTSELLKTCGSEAALVGVVAHELSHLDRGHQLYALKQIKLVQQAPSVRNMMGAVAAATKPFHAEFESQADGDAFDWMIATGYDPRELARLLDRWNLQQDQRRPWMDALPSFIRSHPDAGLRAQAIFKRFDDLPPGATPMVVGESNLEQRIPAFEEAHRGRKSF